MDIWEKQFLFYAKLKENNLYDELLIILRDFFHKTEDINLIAKDWDNEMAELFSDYYSEEFKRTEIIKNIIFRFSGNAKKYKKLIREKYKNSSNPNAISKKYLTNICQYFFDIKNDIHHCICEELFRNMMNGDDSNVYVYIDNYQTFYQHDNKPYMSAFMHATEEEFKPAEYLHCSLVTQDMLTYDYLMFQTLLETDNTKIKDIKQLYRPYFAEFIIPVDQNGYARGRYNPNDNLDEINSENGWFIASVVASDISGKNSESSFVEGEILTCASPAKSSKGTLRFKRRFTDIEKKEIDCAYSFYTRHTRCDFTSILTRQATNIQKATIYNIGHGNFIALGDSNKDTKIVYDIGTPYKAELSQYAAKKIMETINPDLVIISHWDSDHYLGAFQADSNIYDATWVAVMIIDEGYINAKRIINYLACRHLIALISPTDPSIPQPFAEYSNGGYKIQLFRGSGTSSPITPINCHGIAIRIESRNVTTLMCGDIPYDCLPDSIVKNNNYDYMVIPHHASNMSRKSYNSLRTISSIKHPIICVNGDEELGHTKVSVENGKHCDEIKKKSNSCLYFTDNDDHSMKGYVCDLKNVNPKIQYL